MIRRIILHWTAGTNQPSSTDYKHYHYLINGDGLVILGKHKVSDNENCNDGVYAAHTGSGNTGSIGIAVCGMHNYKSPQNIGKYPLTKIQIEKLFEFTAKLCKEYKLPITPDTVLTHYEFGKRNPKTSSAGKIDITYLPSYPSIKANEVGDFIRNKVKWYYQKQN